MAKKPKKAVKKETKKEKWTPPWLEKKEKKTK